MVTQQLGLVAYVSSYTDSDAAYIAGHYNFLDTLFDIDAATITLMHATNANLKVLGYKDLIGMLTTYDDWAVVDAQADWFLKTAGGDRIQHTSFLWYLMDPANAAWRAYFVAYLNTKIAAGGYDGVFLDDTWNDVSVYATSLNGVVQAADVASWHADVLAFITYIKANITSGKLVFVNSDEFATSTYVSAVDGEMLEGYIHADWLAPDNNTLVATYFLLSKLVTDSGNNKYVWCHSGTLTAGETNATIQDVAEFCFSGFLIGADSTYSIFGFNTWSDVTKGYAAVMYTDVKTASASYTTSDSCYLRNFTHGKAVFNPANTAYSNLALGASYIHDGATVTTLDLAAYSGAVCLLAATTTGFSAPISFSSLFNKTLATVEAQGVDCEVTLKTLSLGAADATTGQYSTFYTDSTLHVIMVDPSVGFNVLGVGLHGQLKTDAYSDPAVEVKHGDRILDSFSQTWEVETVAPNVVGDLLTHYKLVLSLVEPVEIGGSPEGGAAPGRGIGVAEPIQLHIELENWTEIISPTVARIELEDWTEIITPTVAAIALTTYIPHVGGAVWLVDCAWTNYGTLTPAGLQIVTDGNTQAVTAVADTANGYVCDDTTPFALDNATYDKGSVAADGTASYTVPDQTAQSWHQLKFLATLGWGCTSAVATPTGYSRVASASTKTYTAAGAPDPGEHWHIWLDGTTDLGHSPAVVPAQTNGTYHAVTQVSTL